MNPDKRKENETQEAYRARLRRQKTAEKSEAKGTLVWDSTRQGTYRKPRP